MGRSGFVDITGVAEGGVCALIVTLVFDADGDAQKWPRILCARGGRVVREELCNAVGRSVCLKSLLEKNVPDGSGWGSSDAA